MLRLLAVSALLFYLAVPAGAQNCFDNFRVSVAFSGDTTLSTCELETTGPVRFQVQPFTTGTAYVVVDADGIIQYIGYGNFIDFAALPAGGFEVYAFSTRGGRITASVGEVFSGATLARPCFGLSRNSVRVLNGTTGTDIRILSALESYQFCAAAGRSDTVLVSGSDPEATFLLTDTNGVVLATYADSVISLGPFVMGSFRLYALNGLTIEPGRNIEGLAEEGGCGLGLSGNFITVTRELPEAGEIELATEPVGGSICSEALRDNPLRFTANSTTSNYRYLVTLNGIVVDTFSGPDYTAATLPTDVYAIFGLAYTGNLTVQIGSELDGMDLATGCSDLTARAIPLDLTRVDGGMILGNGRDSLFFTRGDPAGGEVAFSTTSSTAAENYFYVVTTATEQPVVIGFVEENRFDFTALPLEEVRVYGIGFTGVSRVVVGYPITLLPLSDGCFALSENFVTVITTAPEGGLVGTQRDGFDGRLAGLSISPNPASTDRIRISLQQDAVLPAGQLYLLDVRGRTLASYELAVGSNHKAFYLPAGALAPGLYVVVYATSAGRAFTRFIKP